MAKIAGFEELDVFLTKTARGVLIKTKNDMGNVASAIGRVVVLTTPVGGGPLSPDDPHPGLARGNWQATLNLPASQATSVQDTSGAATVLRIANVARQITVDTSFHLVNRVPYIGLLDRGHSPQAPPGYIRAAVQAGFRVGQLKSAADRRNLLQLAGSR